MLRKLGIAMTWGCVLSAACSDPRVIDGPEDPSTTSTPGASTTGDPLPDTTTSSTSGGTTSGGTTVALDDATSSGTASTSTGTGGGFIFDLGVIPDLPFDLPPVLDYDCDDLTEPFIMQTELVAPRGYHDVAFDDEGNIIGSDGNSLLKVTYDNEVDVFLPGTGGGVQGMDMLEDGDLLFVNYSELRRVTPDMQNTMVAGGFSGAYGITVGPDQMAYVCTSYGIYRVDPDTGEQEQWLTLPGSQTPRAMVFNLDSTGAYMSTLLEPGSPVYFVEVDEDLDPVGAAVVFANGVGQGYHDGLGIDACGNLYVPDYSSSGLYRVDPDGVVTVLYAEPMSPFNHYGHGLEWGSGIDGWNDHAIYLPQPYDGNTVNEIDLGVPSGSTVRTWN
jgi:hypothetical protein